MTNEWTFAAERRLLAAKHDAAIVTMHHLGYTYAGGAQWKPPIGASAMPLIDRLDAKDAEIAALKADAARYRYLRGFERTTVATETEDLVWASCFDTQDGLDIAIDEAMAQAVQPV